MRTARGGAHHDRLVATSLFALIALVPVVAGAADAKDGASPIKVDGTKMTFDPKTCTRGEAGVFLPLGSAGVKVLRHEDGQCVFEFTKEIEGGFLVYLCRVPIDGGAVTIKGWETPFPLKKCPRIRDGNVLNGRTTIHYRDLPIPGTDRHLLTGEGELGEAEPAKGAPVKAGQKVRLRANVCSDAGFTGRAKNAKADQPVEFVLGSGKPWKWLDPALTGARVGARLRVHLPASAAEGAADWLPAADRGQEMYIELEVLSAE